MWTVGLIYVYYITVLLHCVCVSHKTARACLVLYRWKSSVDFIQSKRIRIVWGYRRGLVCLHSSNLLIFCCIFVTSKKTAKFVLQGQLCHLCNHSTQNITHNNLEWMCMVYNLLTIMFLLCICQDEEKLSEPWKCWVVNMFYSIPNSR